MQLRRRLTAKRSRPALAVVLAAALVGTAAFGGNQVLNTDSAGDGPIDVYEDNASLASGEDVVVSDPAVAAQGGDGPRTVKEFTRDDEFSMFALTWTEAEPPVAFVRAELDGGWGPWRDLEPLDQPGANGVHGTELIYIEPTHKVQVSTAAIDLLDDAAPETAAQDESASKKAEESAPDEAATDAASESAAASEPAGDGADTDVPQSDPQPAGAHAPAPADYANIRPVAEEQPLAPSSADDYQAVFMDGNAQAGIAPAAVTDGMPDVVSRAGWGANENQRCSQPEIDDHVSALTIHHTASSNNYTRAQAAAQVRSFFQYHAVTLGWCDIGYNALVDKFGTVYEGRYGGLTKAVQGAHAGGFNQNTWGISMIGDFSTETPPDAMLESVGKLAGWRAAVAGIDPTDESTHYSEGTSYTKYPYGQAVTLPNIFAHRDVGLTTCPGDAGYAQMDHIRSLAKKHYDSIKSGHATSGENTDSSSETSAEATSASPTSTTATSATSTSASATTSTQTSPETEPTATSAAPTTSTPTSAATTAPSSPEATASHESAAPTPSSTASTPTSTAETEEAEETEEASTTTTTSEPTEAPSTAATTTAAASTITPQDLADGTGSSGPLSGGDPEVTELLAELSSMPRSEQVAALGGLAAQAVSAFLSHPGVQATISRIGDVPVLGDLTLKVVPAVVDELVKLSGDSDIEKKWREVKESYGSVLGDARSGLTTTPAADGAETEYALFDQGIITYSPSTGAHALWGTIADTWAQQGFDLGPLGLPTSEPTETADGKQQASFQGGTITYDSATDEADIELY